MNACMHACIDGVTIGGDDTLLTYFRPWFYVVVVFFNGKLDSSIIDQVRASVLD